MEEERRDPREDISYIKHILERAADGMKTVAPWFLRFGVIWLVYGVLCTILRAVMETVGASAAPILSLAGAVLGWVFYALLGVGAVLCCRRQAGLDTLARRLVDIWGVCTGAFIVLSLCLMAIIPGAAVRIIGFGPEQADGLSRACAVGQSMLFFVLPVLPLLITALFLEKRRMLWACMILALFAAAVMCAHAVLLFRSAYAAGRLWGLSWTAAACLLDIVPGILLILFARSLKRG